MTEREEDEELLSDHNCDEVIVFSFDESPAYIKVSQQRNVICSNIQIFRFLPCVLLISVWQDRRQETRSAASTGCWSPAKTWLASSMPPTTTTSWTSSDSSSAPSSTDTRSVFSSCLMSNKYNRNRITWSYPTPIQLVSRFMKQTVLGLDEWDVNLFGCFINCRIWPYQFTHNWFLEIFKKQLGFYVYLGKFWYYSPEI